MRRGKNETIQHLIDTTLTLLKEEGFNAIGVNAIAKKANVNTVLIYRYFKNLEGLLTAASKATNMYPSSAEVMKKVLARTDNTSAAVFIVNCLREYMNAFEQCDFALTVFAWEIQEGGKIAEIFGAEREREGIKLMKLAAEYLKEKYNYTVSEKTNALITTIVAGLMMLHLKKKSSADFNGLKIRQIETWDVLYRTYEQIFNSTIME